MLPDIHQATQKFYIFLIVQCLGGMHTHLLPGVRLLRNAHKSESLIYLPDCCYNIFCVSLYLLSSVLKGEFYI